MINLISFYDVYSLLFSVNVNFAKLNAIPFKWKYYMPFVYNIGYFVCLHPCIDDVYGANGDVIFTRLIIIFINWYYTWNQLNSFIIFQRVTKLIPFPITISSIDIAIQLVLEFWTIDTRNSCIWIHNERWVLFGVMYLFFNLLMLCQASDKAGSLIPSQRKDTITLFWCLFDCIIIKI